MTMSAPSYVHGATDRPLLICVALWTVTIAFIIYGPKSLVLHRLIS